MALAALVVAVAAVIVQSGATLVTLVLVAALVAGVAAVACWWALTTRKAWKMVLTMGTALVSAAALAAVVVGNGWSMRSGAAAVGATSLVYCVAVRRAVGEDPLPSAEATPRCGAAPSRPWLLVNPHSGGGTAERVGLVAAARRRGIVVHVLAPGDDPARLARQAGRAGADALGAAGGDGTLGTVAAVAIELDVPFVCVPAGTRNHFALDLGLDRDDPLAALEAFAAAGCERRIDAATAGDRLFLNNVSLGAYAEVVGEPGYRDRKLTTARGVVRQLARGERAPLDATFRDPAGHCFAGVQVLHVANNRYRVGASKPGGRQRLDGGVLQVSALGARTGASLVRAAWHRTPGTGWAQWDGTALRVDSPQASLPAGVDGEAVTLETPIRLRVLPGALRVLVPPVTTAAPRGDPLSPRTVRRLARVAFGGAASGDQS